MPARGPFIRCVIIYFGLGELPKVLADLHRHPLLQHLDDHGCGQVRAGTAGVGPHHGWSGLQIITKVVGLSSLPGACMLIGSTLAAPGIW